MGLLYQKRRLKANKMKRSILSTRTMLQRIRFLISFSLIILICYCGIKTLKLSQWYLNSDKLMRADSSVIKIQGNIITPEYKIINIVRQTQLPHTQIFRLNTKELEENILQLQSVKKVYIKRTWWPARMTIILDERIPAFLLAPTLESEPISILSTDGVMIDHDYLPLNPSVKVKKLLTYGVRDGYEETWNKKKVEELNKLTKAIETYSNQEVQYIDIRNEKDVYIMLKEYLVRFGEINDTSLLRAKRIASILPEAKKYHLKYIDLRWDDSYYLRLEGAKEPKKEIKKENLKEQKNNNDRETTETTETKQETAEDTHEEIN